MCLLSFGQYLEENLKYILCLTLCLKLDAHL